MSHLRFVPLLVAGTLAGCGGSSSPSLPTVPSNPVAVTPTPAPTPEPDANIQGNWSGTVQDPVAGAGRFSMRLQQNGRIVGATWGIVFNNMTHTEGGTLTGSVTGNSLDATATPEPPHTCGLRLKGTINGGHITATYTHRNCSTIGNGSIDIRRGSLT
jgi:hypothetical protein